MGASNPYYKSEVNRRAQLKYRYGMTEEEWDQMLEVQQGLCAICGKDPGDRLCVDHDHKTGKVRGLLCRGCNAALGKFYDDPDVVMRAASYLLEHEGE